MYTLSYRKLVLQTIHSVKQGAATNLVPGVYGNGTLLRDLLIMWWMLYLLSYLCPLRTQEKKNYTSKLFQNNQEYTHLYSLNMFTISILKIFETEVF